MELLKLVESDRPKSLGDKIAEFMARPPLPILRFTGEAKSDRVEGHRNVYFAVRNGLPLPVFYGIYVEAKDTETGVRVNYIEKADHIGPFSTDDWRLTLPDRSVVVDIRLGILPFEIQTGRLSLALT